MEIVLVRQLHQRMLGNHILQERHNIEGFYGVLESKLIIIGQILANAKALL